MVHIRANLASYKSGLHSGFGLKFTMKSVKHFFVVGMVVNGGSGRVCKTVFWGHKYNPVQGHEEPEALT